MRWRKHNGFLLPSSMLFWLFALATNITLVAGAGARTSPPLGAVTVSEATISADFTSIQAAVNSLPNDTSSQIVFIYPGTYFEQVSVARSGKTTILGYTENIVNYENNTVNIAFNLSSAETASNNDETGTLRVHKDNFALYNVNLRNTYGIGHQALASSAYGADLSFNAVGFYGYQDTLYAFNGTQFYSGCYVEGATDFIFGQHARVFMHKSTIAPVAAGAITAIGPFAAIDVDLFVINESKIVASASATTSLTGKIFLGRPWTEWAQVVFSNTWMDSSIAQAGWEIWSTATPNIDRVLFAEFNNSGPGSVGPRAPFATALNSSVGYTIGDVLGDTWASWVDQEFFSE
ncbi:carbohydrate esterase family 8 protein [Mycena floridula]|nr:carbohydrate esterase family 8 protein [Mycena floridula]